MTAPRAQAAAPGPVPGEREASSHSEAAPGLVPGEREASSLSEAAPGLVPGESEVSLPFVLTRQHFGATLFDARTHEYTQFDHDAARTLFALAVASNNNKRDVDARVVDALASRGWLALDGSLRARVIDRGEATPHDHLLAPLLVHLEVNAVCNLKCTHCFAAPLPRAGMLSLAEIDDVFAQMSALGAMRVSLTGGEPLMRVDFLDVVDAAIAHGLSVSITTNGLLIDRAWARAFTKRLDTERVQWLNVSLDGATAATNDDVRGSGVFLRVLEKLRVLREEHVPFSLAFTLMRTNLHEVDEMVALAEREGARSCVFRPLYPVGAALHRSDLWPSRDDVVHAFARLGAIASVSACGIATEHGTDGCGAGKTILSLDVEGRASPCGFIGESVLGPSIREMSLEELWSSQHFRRVRDDDGARGCRARARVHGRDPFVQKTGARSLPIVVS